MCPALARPKNFNSNEPVAYAFIHKNLNTVKESSSGGAFTALAETVLESGGIVVGAAWKNDFRVEHIIIDNKADLYKLQKSKYFQSYMGNIYKTIKEKLNNGTKVLFTGTPCQVIELKKYLKQDLLVNQLQFSLPFSNMIASGMEVNMLTDGSFDRDGSVLDYCRLHDMTIQAWSPFQYGFFEGVFIGREKYSELNKNLEELAKKYGITPTGIATAWILRHPAKIQMIAGTTKISRLQEIIDGSKVTLSREEWYKLYLSAGHILP